MAVLKLCAERGCFRRTANTRCDEHQHIYTAMRNARPEHQVHLTPDYRRVRQLVLLREPLCHWCGISPSTECDFVTPLANGGHMSPENAVGSCKSCNSSRGATVRR
jgi:5-methylcytosine-specific restriction endonuclease McrA